MNKSNWIINCVSIERVYKPNHQWQSKWLCRQLFHTRWLQSTCSHQLVQVLCWLSKKPNKIIHMMTFPFMKYPCRFSPLTSRMYSWVLSSYLVLYFSGSLISPLLRLHVTFGAGSPLTIALKNTFLPEMERPERWYRWYQSITMPLISLCVSLPSWVVTAIGFLVKSGVAFPRGSCSTNWVTITPGTLDLFLMATVKMR